MEGNLKIAFRVLCAVAVLSFVYPSAFAQPVPGTEGAKTQSGTDAGPAASAAETDLVLAESSKNADGGTNGSLSNSAWPYFLRMLLTLALVIGAIWLVFRLIRRAGKPKASQDDFVRVLASTALGAGKWMYVVSLGTKAFLVGATDSSINLIHEVEDTELIDEMKLRSATEPATGNRDFSTLLQGFLKPVSKHRAKSENGFPGTDYLSRQRDRLKKF